MGEQNYTAAMIYDNYLQPKKDYAHNMARQAMRKAGLATTTTPAPTEAPTTTPAPGTVDGGPVAAE